MDVHAYLASYESHTIYFLKELIQGTKKYIPCDSVKYLSVPHYKGLGINELLGETLKYPQVVDYLPHEDEYRRLPRQWVINVAYTIIGKPFADWVQERMEQRNQAMIEQRELGIDIDTEILRCFQASTHVSSKCLRQPHLPRPVSPALVSGSSIEGDRGAPSQGRQQAPPEAGRHHGAERPRRRLHRRRP